MLRKFFKYGLLIFSLCVAALQALCHFIPQFNPFEYPVVGLLAYMVPVLAVLNIGFIVLWLFTKKYAFMIIPTLALLSCWNIIRVQVGAHPFNTKTQADSVNSFTIMSYNVRLLDLYNWSGRKETRQDMLNFFQSRNADILCLQEFYSGNDSVGINNIRDIQRFGNYPYYANCVMNSNKRGIWGSIVFSKYPIIRNENHDIDIHGDNLLQQVEIRKAKDTITVFNVHLKSNRFNNNESDLVNSSGLPKWDQDTKKTTQSIYKKIERSTIKRGLEAALVSAKVAEEKHHTVVCGDLNDIPGSYTYFKVKNNLKDLFLTKGFGLGATYNKMIPLLRIDYIFYDSDLLVHDYERIQQAYSDHYPVWGQFSIPSTL